MAIKIEVSKKVKFKVDGATTGEDGRDEKFDFTLVAKRIDGDEVKRLVEDNGDQSIIDFLLTVVESWAGVLDAAGQSVSFTEDHFRTLMRNIPGLAQLTFARYLREIGAKAKN